MRHDRTARGDRRDRLPGLCLSLVLTGVINRAFFGWTIQLAIPWVSLALTPLWIIAAAIVAGLFPAWRAGRMMLAEAIARANEDSIFVLLARRSAAPFGADWKVAAARWQLRISARSSCARRFQDRVVVFHRQSNDSIRPALWLRADVFPPRHSAAERARPEAFAFRGERSEVCPFHGHGCRREEDFVSNKKRVAERLAKPGSMRANGWPGSIDWTLRMEDDGGFRTAARMPEATFDLHLAADEAAGSSWAERHQRKGSGARDTLRIIIRSPD